MRGASARARAGGGTPDVENDVRRIRSGEGIESSWGPATLPLEGKVTRKGAEAKSWREGRKREAKMVLSKREKDEPNSRKRKRMSRR